MPYSLQAILDELHATYQPLSEGQVADYIPELAQASPDWFGICVVTVDGQVFSAGDVTQAFTVQSLSKPFAYGLALEDHGRDYLLSRIGVEPTGRAFNAISLDEATRRPLNPMINAGAIAVDDLIKGADSATRIKRLRAMMARYTGHPMHIDAAVYVSERETGHRNRAIAHLMRQFNMIDNIEDSLDLYFQQCAIIVNCCDLAMMAATLANGGIRPATGEVALQPHCVRDVLSIMYTCGMYDSAGEWAYRVGLPGKSGVSGGLLAVVPGRMGIAVFSPPLDERGHSVRGLRVIEDLSDRLLLHSFDVSQPD